MGNYYYDSFDRTGSSLGTSEAPWAEDSGAWETVSGANAASKGSGGRAALDLGSINQWLEFDWILPNANELPEVNIRSSDGLTSGSYYKLRYFVKDFGDGASVSRVVSGAATSLGYNGPFSNTNATKRWQFLVYDTVSGTTQIEAYVDGGLVHEYTETTSRLTTGNYMFIQHALSSAAVKFGFMTARAGEAENAFPQSASLKGQWKLNESAGSNNAIDTSGASHDLTYHGAPGSITGLESTARTFDGTNDYFDVADHADFSTTTKFTFAAWVYRTQTSICVASKWNYDVGADGWALQPSRVYVGSSTEHTFNGPGTSKWYHIALVVDSSQSTDATKVQVYCNGVKMTKGGTPTVAVNDNADNFVLGDFAGLGRRWNGRMDVAHYWNGVALTDAEVRDLFNGGVPLVYSAGGGDLSVSVNDTVTITESVERFLGLGDVSVNDAITVSESVNLDFFLDVNVNDAITVSESVNLDFFLDINVNDAITVTESVTLNVLSYNITATNNKDAQIYDTNATTNYGSAQVLNIRKTGSAERLRSLISFTLPAGSGTVQRVSLFLRKETNLTADGTINAHQVTQTSWVEAEVTWNIYSTGNNWSAAGGDYSATVIDSVADAANVDDWVRIDLMGGNSDNPLTLTWGDPVDLILKQATESGGTDTGGIYHSKEATDAADRPYVEIEYIDTGTLVVSVVDTITVSESVTLSMNLGDISVNDAITVSEDITVTVSSVGSIDINVNDSITVSEAVSLSMDLGDISVNDAITVSESVNLDFFRDVNVSDSITVSEAVSLTMNLGDISVSDDITISESISTTGTLGDISVFDAVTVTESVTVSFIVDFAVRRNVVIMRLSSQARPMGADGQAYPPIMDSGSQKRPLSMDDDVVL